MKKMSVHIMVNVQLEVNCGWWLHTWPYYALQLMVNVAYAKGRWLTQYLPCKQAMWVFSVMLFK